MLFHSFQSVCNSYIEISKTSYLCKTEEYNFLVQVIIDNMSICIAIDHATLSYSMLLVWVNPRNSRRPLSGSSAAFQSDLTNSICKQECCHHWLALLLFYDCPLWQPTGHVVKMTNDNCSDGALYMCQPFKLRISVRFILRTCFVSCRIGYMGCYCFLT